MKRMERNGKVFYGWDEGDGEAKHRFEASLKSEFAIDELMKSLIKASSELEQQKADAWQSVYEATGLDEDQVLHYNWVSREFRIVERRGAIPVRFWDKVLEK